MHHSVASSKATISCSLSRPFFFVCPIQLSFINQSPLECYSHFLGQFEFIGFRNRTRTIPGTDWLGKEKKSNAIKKYRLWILEITKGQIYGMWQ